MKKLLIACCAALALAGCATTGGTPTTPTPAVCPAGLSQCALDAAELSYNTAAEAWIVARDRNLLSPSQLEQARQALIRSFDALKLARAAFDLRDTSGFAAQVRAVSIAAAEAARLLPQ
jgi:hypothetical protein